MKKINLAPGAAEQWLLKTTNPRAIPWNQLFWPRPPEAKDPDPVVLNEKRASEILSWNTVEMKFDQNGFKVIIAALSVSGVKASTIKSSTMWRSAPKEWRKDTAITSSSKPS